MTQAPPQPAADPAATRCPRCDAPAAPDQLLCLECGERLAIAYRRPPSWRLPAGIVTAVALLAGAGLAIALAEIDDDADRVARAPSPTATVPAPTTPAPDPGATTPGQTAPGASEPTPEPPAPDTEPAAGDVGSWPAGTSAYTVVLLSAGTREAAEQEAREAASQGIDAGVLRSDDYSSLRAGYWVAYGGRFDGQDEAQSEAERYASLGFPGAYVRFVNGGD
jgi:hypothetical protein